MSSPARKLLEGVLVLGIAVGITAAIVAGLRWYYRDTPTELHVLVPGDRTVVLRVGEQEVSGARTHLRLLVPNGRHQVTLLEEGAPLAQWELELPRSTRRVLLPVRRQCFGLYPRESQSPLTRIETEAPVDLDNDYVFYEHHRPQLTRKQRGFSYETEKRTWLLLKELPCGRPVR